MDQVGGSAAEVPSACGVPKESASSDPGIENQTITTANGGKCLRVQSCFKVCRVVKRFTHLYRK